MDWLRRNWPDLLIGVALVAVIAGIIATLISGGSFFPVGQGDRGTTTPPATTAPATTTPPPVGTTQQGATEPGAQPDTSGAAQAPAGADQPAAPQAGQEGAPSGGIAVLPPSGSEAGAQAGPEAAAEPASEPAATAPTETPAEPSAAQPAATGGVTALPPSGSPSSAPSATPSTTPSAPAATTPSAGGVPASAGAAESSYRVGVGAFGNADNAQRLAQQFQAAGYPVLLGEQGDLTIVLVGPYATESEARTVADQVRSGNFGVPDPTVYLYEPDDAGTTATTPAAPAPAASAPPAAAPAPAATSAAGRYLQVGAYANRESSLPQRERLEGMGFSVAEVQEGSFVKLLVGPYAGADLEGAQSRLAAEGIENFARGL